MPDEQPAPRPSRDLHLRGSDAAEPAEDRQFTYSTASELPTTSDMGITPPIEWDVDIRYLQSALSAPSFPGTDAEIGRARSAAGPIDMGAAANVLGGASAILNLVYGDDPGDMIEGVAGVLENVAGLGSMAANAASRAPVSILANRLAAGSALLSVVPTFWEALAGGGKAIHEAVEDRRDEGAAQGYLVGFSAGVISMTPEAVAEKLLSGLEAHEPLASQRMAEQAHIDAFVENAWKGYEAAIRLPEATRFAIFSEADRYATANDVALMPRRDLEVAVVEGLAQVLPMVAEAVREGSWEPGSDHLREADEAYTSEAVPDMVLGEGEDLWGLARHTLEEAWRRPPSESEIMGYYHALLERNEGVVPPSSDPADVQSGTPIDLPPVPPDPAPFRSRLEEQDGPDAENDAGMSPQNPQDAIDSNLLFDMEAEANARLHDMEREAAERSYDITQDIQPTGTGAAEDTTTQSAAQVTPIDAPSTPDETSRQPHDGRLSRDDSAGDGGFNASGSGAERPWSALEHEWQATDDESPGATNVLEGVWSGESGDSGSSTQEQDVHGGDDGADRSEYPISDLMSERVDEGVGDLYPTSNLLTELVDAGEYRSSELPGTESVAIDFVNADQRSVLGGPAGDDGSSAFESELDGDEAGEGGDGGGGGGG